MENRLAEIAQKEKETIKHLGYSMGFGRIMQLAQECWRERSEMDGFPSGGEFAIGPCVALTVPCGCKNPAECDWCCGAGWLTKKAKDVQEGRFEG